MSGSIEMVFGVEHLVVTPVRNEEDFLPLLIKSMIKQTKRPDHWIIVDDASADDSGNIAKRAAEKYRWIQYIRTDFDGERKRGSRIAKLFNVGIDNCKIDWHLCSKIDADMILPVSYFSDIIGKFERDKALGVGSGNCSTRSIFGNKTEIVTKGHTRGGLKTYRKECYTDIGGIDEVDGWDGIDNVRAAMRGWKTENFPEIIALHQRPTGTYNGKLRGNFEAGQFASYMGYFFPYLVARCIWEMRKWPFILGGFSLFLGYLRSEILNEEKFHDTEILEEIRNRQKKKILCFWRN